MIARVHGGSTHVVSERTSETAQAGLVQPGQLCQPYTFYFPSFKIVEHVFGFRSSDMFAIHFETTNTIPIKSTQSTTRRTLLPS